MAAVVQGMYGYGQSSSMRAMDFKKTISNIVFNDRSMKHLHSSGDSADGVKTKGHFILNDEFLDWIVSNGAEIQAEWSMIEYFFDTPDFSLMNDNLWLRGRISPKDDGHLEPQLEFCLQKMEKVSENLLKYRAYTDEDVIRKKLKKAGVNVIDDEYLIFAQPLKQYCRLCTQRFRVADGCYIDACMSHTVRRDTTFEFVSGCFEDDFPFSADLKITPSCSKPVWYLNDRKLPLPEDLSALDYTPTPVVQKFQKMVEDKVVNFYD